MKHELHVVSNGKLSFEQMADVALQTHSYVDYFHIREREKSGRELYEGVTFLIEKGVSPSKLVLNDRIDIAILTGVNRVQLGYRSPSVQAVKERFHHLHVGCSIHSLEEGIEAQKNGADSVLYGHIFSTFSKEGLPPRGVTGIKNLASSLSIPVTAIGGITPENAMKVLGAGASGIAVMSGIWNAKDPLQAAKDYKELLRKQAE